MFGFFRKLRTYVIPNLNLFGSQDDYTRADAKTLKEAYHSRLFVKTIVNISANFTMPAPPVVHCEDKDAEEFLNKLYRDYYETLLSVARDTSLTGNGYIKVAYSKGKGIDLIEVYPSKVVIVPNPLDLREYERVEITHQPDPNYSQNISIVREVWDKNTVKVYINDRLEQRFEHRLGEIPIIHVAYNRFSNELYGTGDINDAVFRLIQQYERVLEIVMRNFLLIGKPLPVFRVESPHEFEERMKEVDFERLPGLALKNTEDAEYLEPKNVLKDAVDLLERIFYNIVILSETPEFLMGVHTPSSWASVKEQLHPIVRKVKRYQSIWKEKLKELNRIVLKYLETFEGAKFSTYETEIEFPEVEVKDIKEYAQALAQLVGAGIMKPEEARGVLKSAMSSFAQIVEQLKEETDAYSPDKNWNDYS